MGIEILAVDKSSSVIEIARNKDDTHRVQFQSIDLRDVDMPIERFNGVSMIETLGLMSKEDERRIFSKVRNTLKDPGGFVVDCCESADPENSWSKEFDEGVINCRATFDAQTRMQHIDFHFTPTGGDTFGLYDPLLEDRTGISRYLYPKEELKLALEEAGFHVVDIPHYYPTNYYALLAR